MSQFELLDDDTTILMINQDTFTVARLRQLISQKLSKKLDHRPEKTSSYNIRSSFYEGLVIVEEQNVRIPMSNFQMTFPTNGMVCQLLDFNTKQWKKGKLKIFIDIQLGKNGHQEVKLEFATDEPPTSDLETSLDAIRQLNLENPT